MPVIAPNVGDMTNCKKKPKCKWGEYEGQSLPDDGDNCPSGYSFREDYCDCQSDDNCGTTFRAYYATKGTINAICDADCAITGPPFFGTTYIQLSAANKWSYSGSFSHSSISEYCSNGPVNCGATPADYGVSSLRFSSGGDIPLGPGGVMSCGDVDSLFVTFVNCCDEDEVIGVLVATSAGGATSCMVNMHTLTSVEPAGTYGPREIDYVWSAPNYVGPDLQLNSVNVAPEQDGPPYSIGNNTTSSDPHAYAYYPVLQRRCNGATFANSMIVRGPLGSVPPFPSFTRSEEGVPCCN